MQLGRMAPVTAQDSDDAASSAPHKPVDTLSLKMNGAKLAS